MQFLCQDEMVDCVICHWQVCKKSCVIFWPCNADNGSSYCTLLFMKVIHQPIRENTLFIERPIVVYYWFTTSAGELTSIFIGIWFVKRLILKNVAQRFCYKVFTEPWGEDLETVRPTTLFVMLVSFHTCLFMISLFLYSNKMFPVFGFGAQVPPSWQVCMNKLKLPL